MEKPKIGNEITGIDTFDKMVKPGVSVSIGLAPLHLLFQGSNSDLYDEKVPDVADYGDTSNRSGKGGGGSKKSDVSAIEMTSKQFL